VLEGLEPVRRRPGMYIGGTDEKALHHLFAEVIDNAMDEALAGHATGSRSSSSADGFLTVTDNGRGIPVDPHPKFPKQVGARSHHDHAAFGRQVRLQGLRDLGRPARRRRLVVNALSSELEVEVARDKKLYRQTFERGKPKGKLEELGKIPNRRGTTVASSPTRDLRRQGAFKPARLFKMARSKAYLFGGVEIRWRCDPELLKGVDDVPAEAVFHFPGGLADYLAAALTADEPGASGHLRRQAAARRRPRRRRMGGRLAADADGFVSSYCNTIPTPDGGTHEAGLRAR
jgi:topoisomerase-4 subunit B